MARFFALVTAVLAAATIATAQVTSIGHTYQPGRGAFLGGAVYFPDTAGHVILKLDTASGVTSVVSGLRGTSGATEGNSADAAARWNAPQGVCTDGTDLFVADTGNHKLRKITLATGQTGTVIGSGTAGHAVGTGAAATIDTPTDCQFIGTSNVYVTGSNKVTKVVVATNVSTVLTGPASGANTAADYADGTTANNNARFRNTLGLCSDGTDLFVVDGNQGVRKVVVADGTTTSVSGASTNTAVGFVDSATAANVRYNGPTDCAYHGATNELLIADKGNHAVRRLVVGGAVTTYIGNGVAGIETAGATGTDTKLYNPIGVVGDAATGAATNYYVLEQFSTIHKNLRGATSAGATTLMSGIASTQFPSNFYACARVTADHYCTDPQRHVVWKILGASGAATVHAGILDTPGDAEGATGTGKLNGPTGIVTDGTDFVVSDTGNHKLRRILADGTLSTPAGFGVTTTCYPNCAAGSTLANSNTQQYNTPKGLAWRSTGGAALFVADSGNHRIVSLSAFNGGVVPAVIAGTSGTAGDANGAIGAAQLRNPEGVCVFQPTTTGTEGAILIADTGNNKFKATAASTLAGTALGLSTTAGTTITMFGPTANTGNADAGDVSSATGANQRFRSPKACACDAETGTTAATFCVVADSGNNKVKKILLSATDASKTMTVFGAADGTTTAGDIITAPLTNLRWNNPASIFRQSATSFAVTDSGNRHLKYVTDAGVVTTTVATDVHPSVGAQATNTAVAGSNPWTVSGTAPAVDGRVALFNQVRGVASFPVAAASTTAAETFYVADYVNHVIRRVVYNHSTGVSTVSTFLGTPGTSGDVITPQASVLFNNPSAIVANGTDTLYVADSGNNKIKKIVIAADGTATVTIFAGGAAGTTSTGDVVGSDATVRFNGPQGLAIAGSAHNLYVADTSNHKIKMITSAGVVSLVWGPSTAASGNADSATPADVRFNTPTGITGNATHVVVADAVNNRIKVCTVGAGCTTWLGAASGSADGTGIAATFNTPAGVAFDQFGNVYVADFGNNKIRKATPAGVVTTVVGAGGAGALDQAVAANGIYTTATLNGPANVYFSRVQPVLALISEETGSKIRVAANIGTAAVTVTATATQTNTTTTTVTNTTTATVTTTANTTTAATTSTASNATTVAPTTTAARGSSNAVVAAATAVIVAVLAIFA